jgi:hypothetical protein
LAGILLPCSRYFPCFPVGSSDCPASFLPDPVAETIDLGVVNNQLMNDYLQLRIAHLTSQITTKTAKLDLLVFEEENLRVVYVFTFVKTMTNWWK